MKTIRLLACDNLTEAYLIKARLNNAGIECFLTNQNFTNLMPIYNNMLGSGIQVVINENDLTAARELLKDKLNPERIDLLCPNCDSSNVIIEKYKGSKILNLLISVFTSIPIGNLKPTYYCKDCKTEIK